METFGTYISQSGSEAWRLATLSRQIGGWGMKAYAIVYDAN